MRYHIPGLAVNTTPSVQDYLEIIYDLCEEGEEVIQARIAQRLKKSAASVSEMLDRLAAEGLIRRSNRHIVLTKKGEQIAEKITRRHRLAERLLVDVIGLPWHKAHEEALKWQHVISDEVEERLVKLLENPTTCPHGNPIPGAAPAHTLKELSRLSDLPAGQRFVLRRVTEKVELEFDWLRYLDEKSLRPGASGKVVEVSPDKAVAAEVNGRIVMVGPDLARELYVSVLN